jgi:hypothetical protein
MIAVQNLETDLFMDCDRLIVDTGAQLVQVSICYDLATISWKYILTKYT